MPRRPSRKVLIVFFTLVILGLAELTVIVWKIDQPKLGYNNSNQSSSPNSAEAFNKKQYSISDPASPWVIVNKGRVLPSDYSPSNLAVPDVPLRSAASSPEMLLRSDAAAALETMVAAASRESINLRLASGYRSYDTQVSVYGAEVKNFGQTAADRESARPGHSEHQTGLAADLEPFNRICEVDPCFANTQEGKWLAANAYKYGFVIRYQVNNEDLTGYKYEPWHVRYVGAKLAAEIDKTGQTLEQFFDLRNYTSYPPTSYELKSGS